jgi:hypothetical protein
MFHLQNYKTMKANVQISAVKKEFKNGQQGWQVFVDGMEGRLRCEMNFKDALKAIRYCFLLSKRLELQINDVQLAALSLDYQKAKKGAQQAQVAEEATEVAQEMAAEAGAEQGEPSNEMLEAARKVMSCTQMYKFREQHPDAVVIQRKKLTCTTFGESAEACAAALDNTPEHLFDGTLHFLFDIELLDKCLQKLVADGKHVALYDIDIQSPEELAEFQAMVDTEIARNKKEAESAIFKQFCDLKKKHPEALLLFRSGDFYKCYEEDAIKAAEILAIASIKESADSITIAGFPYHALDTYLPKLIRAGIRVAICDDITDFVKKPTKKPTEIVTPTQQELFA